MQIKIEALLQRNNSAMTDQLEHFNHFSSSNSSCGSLGPSIKLPLKVLENTTPCSYVECRHQLFSPWISSPYLFSSPFLFGISCEVGTLQSRQIDSAADWKILFICLVELCRHLSWAPLQNLTLFTLNIWPLCDTLQHAGTEKMYLWRKGEGKKTSWIEKKKCASLTQYFTSVKHPTSC